MILKSKSRNGYSPSNAVRMNRFFLLFYAFPVYICNNNWNNCPSSAKKVVGGKGRRRYRRFVVSVGGEDPTSGEKDSCCSAHACAQRESVSFIWVSGGEKRRGHLFGFCLFYAEKAPLQNNKWRNSCRPTDTYHNY